MKNSLKYGSYSLFILLTLVPLGLGLGYAFLYSIGAIGILSKGLTLAFWQAAFTSSSLGKSFAFSFYIALVTLTVSTVLALLLQSLWRKDFRSGRLGYMLYFPLSIPYVVAAFFTFQLLSQSGFLARIAYHLHLIQHIQDFPGLVNDPRGFGIIFSHVFLATPFFTLLFLSVYDQNEVAAYEQAASTLGASRWQIKWRVSWPILLKHAYPTLALYFIVFMGSYEIPLLLGVQSPEMVSVFTLRKMQRFNLADIPQAYIVAFLYSMLVLGLVMVLFLRKKQKPHEG